jgi:fumarate reductase subunit D
LTEQPPNYPPPPPGGYGYPPPSGGYGYPPPGPGYPPPQAVGTNGMAIASLVSSLFGWLCVIGPILGLVFGFIALGQIKQTGQGGRGLAIAGIAIGAVVIVLGIVFGILSAIGGSMSHTDSGAPAVVIIVERQPVLPIVTI